MSRKLHLGIILIIIANLGLSAQDSLRNKDDGFKNIYSVDILRPYVMQFRVGYERVITPQTSLSAKLGTLRAKNDSYTNRSFLTYFPVYGRVFDGFYGALGYYYTLEGDHGLYFGSDISYFFKYFNEKLYLDFTGMDYDSWVYLNSLYRHKFGAMLVAGYKFKLYKGASFLQLLDLSIGIGAQYRWDILTEHGISWQHYNFDFDNYNRFEDPIIIESFKFLPLAEFNLKYSISYKKYR